MTLKELIAFLRSHLRTEVTVSRDLIYETQLNYAEFEAIGACAAHIAEELVCQQVKLENGDYKFFTTK